jgi:hypothetical protein
MIEMIPSNPMGGKNATMINGESTMKVDHVLGEMCIDWVRSKIFSLHSSNDWFRSLSTWHDEFPFYPWCQMVPMFPIFLNEVVQVVLMLQMVPGPRSIGWTVEPINYVLFKPHSLRWYPLVI